jgi:hypothetical protein
MGKKGGARTLELYGPEHFSKAAKARKTFGGGYPKGRPRKPKAEVDRSKGKAEISTRRKTK